MNAGVNTSLPADAPFLCSWSGGKDCCLALHRALNMGAGPARLLTMLNENGVRCRSHGLTRNVLEAQAACLGLPLHVGETSRSDYESAFRDGMIELKRRGAVYAVFGDIDFPPHLEWEQRVCSSVGLQTCHPLWEVDREALLAEFLDSGFTAVIVSVQNGVLDNAFLGKPVTRQMLEHFADLGIDVCGENGEYHTIVTNGPVFGTELKLEHGDIYRTADYAILEVSASS